MTGVLSTISRIFSAFGMTCAFGAATVYVIVVAGLYKPQACHKRVSPNAILLDAISEFFNCVAEAMMPLLLFNMFFVYAAFALAVACACGGGAAVLRRRASAGG